MLVPMVMNKGKIVVLALLCVALAGACTRADRTAPAPANQGHESAEGADRNNQPSTEDTMTADSPGSAGNTGDSWDQARAVAASHLGVEPDKLNKRNDELPYMFTAPGVRGVLVHQGKVVTDTGPAVAAGYLRDMGVVEGRGPSLNSVLYVLFALRALPAVDKLGEEAYIHSPGVKRMEALTARVEQQGGVARIVLHYFLPEPPVHGGGDTVGRATRPVARLTLEISKSAEGKPEWQRQDIQWTSPE